MVPAAKRLFNGDGNELDDCMMIVDGDILFLSFNEDFISPFQQENDLNRSKHGTSNIPLVIGGYVVGSLLGRGGFGEVRYGEHQLTGEKVALKFLNKSEIHSVGAAERTNTEIQCLQALKHANIIRLQQHLESVHHVVLVFELMEGGDLLKYLQMRAKKIIAANGQNGNNSNNTNGSHSNLNRFSLSEDEARHVFYQILSAVSYAHNQHICHRDLKLENILLKEDSLSMVKIADFGLSDFYRPGATMKSNCGTLSFLAPEVFKGSSNAGPPLDVWALGVILFSLLCGRLPFEGTDLSGINRPRESIIKSRIMKCQYKVDDKLGPEAKDLIRRMLQSDPSERASIPEIFNHIWVRNSSQLFGTQSESFRLSSPSIFSGSNNSSAKNTPISSPTQSAIVKKNANSGSLNIAQQIKNVTPTESIEFHDEKESNEADNDVIVIKSSSLNEVPSMMGTPSSLNNPLKLPSLIPKVSSYEDMSMTYTKSQLPSPQTSPSMHSKMMSSPKSPRTSPKSLYSVHRLNISSSHSDTGSNSNSNLNSSNSDNNIQAIQSLNNVSPKASSHHSIVHKSDALVDFIPIHDPNRIKKSESGLFSADSNTTGDTELDSVDQLITSNYYHASNPPISVVNGGFADNSLANELEFGQLGLAANNNNRDSLTARDHFNGHPSSHHNAQLHQQHTSNLFIRSASSVMKGLHPNDDSSSPLNPVTSVTSRPTSMTHNQTSFDKTSESSLYFIKQPSMTSLLATAILHNNAKEFESTSNARVEPTGDNSPQVFKLVPLRRGNSNAQKDAETFSNEMAVNSTGGDSFGSKPRPTTAASALSHSTFASSSTLSLGRASLLQHHDSNSTLDIGDDETVMSSVSINTGHPMNGSITPLDTPDQRYSYGAHLKRSINNKPNPFNTNTNGTKANRSNSATPNAVINSTNSPYGNVSHQINNFTSSMHSRTAGSTSAENSPKLSVLPTANISKEQLMNSNYYHDVDLSPMVMDNTGTMHHHLNTNNGIAGSGTTNLRNGKNRTFSPPLPTVTTQKQFSTSLTSSTINFSSNVYSSTYPDIISSPKNNISKSSLHASTINNGALRSRFHTNLHNKS